MGSYTSSRGALAQGPGDAVGVAAAGGALWGQVLTGAWAACVSSLQSFIEAAASESGQAAIVMALFALLMCLLCAIAIVVLVESTNSWRERQRYNRARDGRHRRDSSGLGWLKARRPRNAHYDHEFSGSSGYN